MRITQLLSKKAITQQTPYPDFKASDGAIQSEMRLVTGCWQSEIILPTGPGSITAIPKVHSGMPRRDIRFQR